MNNNSILSLNHIIYEIYNTEDFEKMKECVLKGIYALIPSACVSIMMANSASSERKTCHPVCYPPDYIGMENKFLRYMDEDYTRWIMEKNTSCLIKSSEMMPESERVNTTLYRKCYAPFNVHYSTDCTLVKNGEFLGVLALYRSKESGDLSEEDTFMVQLIAEHLSSRFYQETSERRKRNLSIQSIAEIIRKYHLTERESEILQMIFEGRKNEEITDYLCISKLTLKKHLQNIYRKTGTSGRMELRTLRCETNNIL